MNIRLNINKIKTIILYLIAGLPGCCLILGSVKLRLSLLLGIGFIVLYALLNTKTFYKELKQTFSNVFGKILLVWIIWCFISVIYNVIFSGYSLTAGLYYFFFHGILLILMPYYLAYTIVTKMKNEQVIKYYLIFVFIIYVLGLINYIFLYSGIPFLQSFFSDYIVNTRQDSGYSELFRVKSTFVEPSYFANFICCNLPLCYLFVNAKFQISSNKTFNYIVKNTMWIVAWFLIVTTKSPIFILFAVLISFAYVLFYINKEYLKRFFIIFTILLLFLFLFNILIIDNINIDISQTFIKRIQATIDSFGSFEKFIIVETSLATRIVNYVNQFILFTNNIIFGVGYGNIIEPLRHQFSLSPLPLTYEIKGKLATGMANSTIAWMSLAETGLIGTLLLYTFFFVIIRKTIYLVKLLKNTNNVFFIRGILWAFFIITIISFYDGEFAGIIVVLYAFMAGYYPKLIKKNN